MYLSIHLSIHSCSVCWLSQFCLGISSMTRSNAVLYIYIVYIIYIHDYNWLYMYTSFAAYTSRLSCTPGELSMLMQSSSPQDILRKSIFVWVSYTSRKSMLITFPWTLCRLVHLGPPCAASTPVRPNAEPPPPVDQIRHDTLSAMKSGWKSMENEAHFKPVIFGGTSWHHKK